MVGLRKMLQTLQQASLIEKLDRDHQKRQEHRWKAIGHQMRIHRKNARVSLRELARRMKISAPFLSDMERGGRHYTQKNISSAISALANKADIPPGQ